MRYSARIAFVVAGLGIWLTWTDGSVHAQIPGYRMDRSQTPAFSPYLNLLRGGSSPAINYYGIVRPEITFANSLYQLEGQQNQLQAQQNELGNQQGALAAQTTLPATGHASGFMTQSKFFMTSGGQGQANNFAPGGFGPQILNKGK